MGDIKSPNDLPDKLKSTPRYVYPSKKCPRCTSGVMHIEYSIDPRLMACDLCLYYDTVNDKGELSNADL